MMIWSSEQLIESASDVNEKLAVVRHDLEDLERRVALIEDMLAAIRSEDERA